MKTFAVILARGGSKGIPKKNIMEILGKPLIKWSIEQALNSSVIEDVYVSSDDAEILECAEESGAIAVTRPAELSGDQSTSEAGWLDVLSRLHPRHLSAEFFFALQATSPVRDAFDFDLAHEIFVDDGLDSLFSAEKIRDHYIWELSTGAIVPSNFKYSERGMRQNLKEKFLENGSFYILNKNKFLQNKVRQFGKLGVYEMPKYKSIQIDQIEDAMIAEALMMKFRKC